MGLLDSYRAQSLANPMDEMVRNAAKQRTQQATQALQQGGYGAVFNQSNVDPSQSVQGMLANGNLFSGVNQTAAAYTPEQVMQMQQTQPMRMGDTSQYAYQGQMYNAPAGLTPMGLYNALTPAMQQQAAQGAVGAGSQAGRDLRMAGVPGAPSPSFQPAPTSQPMGSPPLGGQQPAQGQPMARPQFTPYANPYGIGGGMGGGRGLFNYGQFGGFSSPYAGWGSSVMRRF